MKLYGDFLSPFVRMSMVAAIECGLADRVTHVRELVKPTEENKTLAGMSAIGKVPVLQTNHGHAIYDSRVIIEYFAHVSGDGKLIPDEGVKRFRVLTLQALGQGLADAAVSYRYETAARPAGLKWNDYARRLEQRMGAIIADAESHWLAELAEVNAGSIAVAVALSYMDYRLPDFKWKDQAPKLEAFRQGMLLRDSFIKTAISA